VNEELAEVAGRREHRRARPRLQRNRDPWGELPSWPLTRSTAADSSTIELVKAIERARRHHDPLAPAPVDHRPEVVSTVASATMRVLANAVTNLKAILASEL
jgi:hypothetical protein